MKKEKTLKEKREWLYDFIYNNSINKKRAKIIYEMLLKQDEQFINEILETNYNQDYLEKQWIKRFIEINHKKPTYKEKLSFNVGISLGTEIVEQIIKQKAGFEE